MDYFHLNSTLSCHGLLTRIPGTLDYQHVFTENQKPTVRLYLDD